MSEANAAPAEPTNPQPTPPAQNGHQPPPAPQPKQDPAPQPKGPDVDELITQFDQERAKTYNLKGKLADVQKRLAAFDGIDPEKYKAMSEDYENIKKELAETSPEAKKKWQREQEEKAKALADAERAKHEKELADIRAELAQEKSEKRRLLLTERMIREHGSKVHEDGLDYFTILIDQQLDLDGNEIYVKGPDGEPEYSKPGVKKSAAEWVEDFLKKKPIYAKATYNGGGQTPGQKTDPAPAKGPTQLPSNWGSMDIDQRARWMVEHPESKSLFRR